MDLHAKLPHLPFTASPPAPEPKLTPYEYLSGLLVEKFDLPADRITPDANLTDLGLDSLSIVEMVFDVEDEFDIEISQDDADFTSLGGAVNLIERLLAEKKG